MSWITTITNQVKLNEGSTKRGIAATATGCIALYMIFKGQPVDFDSLMNIVSNKVGFWLGIGLNVMGFLGIFVPDEKPKPPAIDEAPADEPQKNDSPQSSVVVSRNAGNRVVPTDPVTQLRKPVPSNSRVDQQRDANHDRTPPSSGWNG